MPLLALRHDWPPKPLIDQSYIRVPIAAFSIECFSAASANISDDEYAKGSIYILDPFEQKKYIKVQSFSYRARETIFRS